MGHIDTVAKDANQVMFLLDIWTSPVAKEASSVVAKMVKCLTLTLRSLLTLNRVKVTLEGVTVD